MIKYTLPIATYHGEWYRFDGPCKIYGAAKIITLESNEQCAFISLWFESEKEFIWAPYERCVKL